MSIPLSLHAYSYVAVAAVLLLALALWSYRRLTQPSVEGLLARAYSEQRTMDLRIAGAAQAPFEQQRGSAPSSLAKSASLLQAEYEIRLKLESRPEDSGVLAEKGRAELLDGQYKAAISSLRHSLDLNAENPSVLGDLATAYTLRGDAEHRPLDYGEAIEYLGQALAKKPRDPVFLFNRALVNERLMLFEQASKDWQHYLEVDSKGSWADEARQHLDAVRQKLKQSLLIPPAEHDPERAISLLVARAEGKVTDPGSWMESLDEDYLDIAVREWLPMLARRHLPPLTASPGDPEWRALNALGQILRVQHGDPWLSDLLSGGLSRSLLQGFTELGAAAQLNLQGNFDGGAAAARRAAQLLSRAENRSGALRAVWEEAYALQRSQQGALCLRSTREATRMGTAARYPWLSAQLAFEQSICLAMLGQLTRAQEGIRRGANIAQSANFGTLELRGLHMAGVEIAAHDPGLAWTWFQQGLQRHWSGSYRPFRAYQFYAEMSFTPESRAEWNLARDLMEEAVAHISRTSNHMTEGIARYSLAVDEQLSGDSREAADEFSRASAVFSSLPDSPTKRTFLFSAEVYQAALEVEQGQTDSALESLSSARRHYAKQTQYRIWQHYYEALGTALLKSGRNTADAERALRAAVSIGEAALANLKTDEDRYLWEKNAAGSYRSLVELTLGGKGDYEAALELWEWYMASGVRTADKTSRSLDIRFDELDSGPILPKLTLVADTLPTLKNTTILSFARLGNKTVIWKFDDRGVRQASVPVSEQELSKAARRFLRLCSDPLSDIGQVSTAGKQLYRWLLAPIASDLDPSRRLAIETDGDIGRIPFGALVTPSGDFLGQLFEIVTSPGLQFSAILHRVRAMSTSNRILVVEISRNQAYLRSNLPALPDVSAEAKEIAKLFPNSTVIVDQKATLENVERELPSVRVFHFAGHAVATTERTGLLFEALQTKTPNDTDARFVGAREFQKLRISKLDLVVLSACATGDDEEGLADPQSLVRVFLRAGVPQVVASRWGVDSGSTAQLMKDFYDGLGKGWLPPLALKRAGEAMRLRTGKMHPYYWASFGVFGRT